MIEVALIAAAVSAGSMLFQKKMVNQDRVDEIKAKMKDYNKRYRKALKEKNEKKIKELEKEGKEVTMMSAELMKHSLKPTMYTLLPILIVISVIKTRYGGQTAAVLPAIGAVDAFWWYVIVAMMTSMVLEVVYQAYRRKKKNGGTRKKNE